MFLLYAQWYAQARILCFHYNKPDNIIGYVTRDRGITIHRRDCPFMQRVPEEKEDRLLEARWAVKED